MAGKHSHVVEVVGVVAGRRRGPCGGHVGQVVRLLHAEGAFDLALALPHLLEERSVERGWGKYMSITATVNSTPLLQDECRAGQKI